MTFIAHKPNIRTIKQDDPLFTISDGLMLCHRAGFEVSQGCPQSYRMIISECIDRGWLKPVAYMTAEEQLIETLKL